MLSDFLVLHFTFSVFHFAVVTGDKMKASLTKRQNGSTCCIKPLKTVNAISGRLKTAK